MAPENESNWEKVKGYDWGGTLKEIGFGALRLAGQAAATAAGLWIFTKLTSEPSEATTSAPPTA